MIKLRITFVDNDKGSEELENTLKELRKSFNILNESKVYKGRGNSQYSNVYIDVEPKQESS